MPEDRLPREKCLCEVLSDVELAWEDGSVRHEKGGSRAPSREPTHVYTHQVQIIIGIIANIGGRFL